ncbi:MAG: T9SS type A sorting domain-containing protein [Lentimicrobiaceae bacterium]|nr:T9SS type A sorting domain-containing protein [Lentimicrobiaceae bacterium]
MKKITLILLVVTTLMGAIFAQPAKTELVVFSEDFENLVGDTLPQGWSSINLSPSGEHWKIVEEVWELCVPHSGEKFALVMYPNGGDDNNAWLFSSGIQLTADTTYNVNFWVIVYGYNLYGFNEYNYLEVKIGTEPTASGMEDGILLYQNTNERIRDWTLISVEFTPAESGIYYIGFHDFTPNDEGIFTALDDVSVTMEIPSKINENTLGNILIYPNPASGVVTIGVDKFSKVEIYNTFGQLVKVEATSVVDVSNFSAGVYIFKVYDFDEKVGVKRVVVRK